VGAESTTEQGRKPKAVNAVQAALIAEAEAEWRGIPIPAKLPRVKDTNMGRPVEYDPAKFVFILDKVSDGTPLAQVCRMEGMPHYTTVMRWVEISDRLLLAFARARSEGFANIEVDMLEISDHKADDFVEDEKGRMRFNGEAVQRSKLRIETRKDLLKVWNQDRWANVLMLRMDPAKSAAGKDLKDYTTAELLSLLDASLAGEQAVLDADNNQA
jgi:hypothetical protein